MVNIFSLTNVGCKRNSTWINIVYSKIFKSLSKQYQLAKEKVLQQLYLIVVMTAYRRCLVKGFEVCVIAVLQKYGGSSLRLMLPALRINLDSLLVMMTSRLVSSPSLVGLNWDSAPLRSHFAPFFAALVQLYFKPVKELETNLDDQETWNFSGQVLNIHVQSWSSRALRVSKYLLCYWLCVFTINCWHLLYIIILFKNTLKPFIWLVMSRQSGH